MAVRHLSLMGLVCALAIAGCTAQPAAGPGVSRAPVESIAADGYADPAVAHANRIASGELRYREAYVGEGDDRLHYVEAGRGPLIVLYHGFPSFWYSWFDQMELLKSCYRVVALDAPGGGLSAKPIAAAPYDIARLAAQLDGFAAMLAPGERFVLVGHDWGGALAWSYAQAYPERLEQLVVMSAPPYNLFVRLAGEYPEQQARSGYMQRFRAISYDDIATGTIASNLFAASYGGLAETGALSAEEHALFRAAVAQPLAVHGGMNWYRANVMDFADMAGSDPWPGRAATTHVPTLLLWGDNDRTFIPEFLDLAPAYASNLTIVHLPGVGHWTSMEQPQLANAAIAQRLMPGGRCPAR